MSTIGDRLREERKRLGLNQDELGVTPQTQRLYENGKSSPDAAYLESFSKLGADVSYIVTGKRSGASLDSEQQRALDAWGRIPGSAQTWLLRLIEFEASRHAVNSDSESELQAEQNCLQDGRKSWPALPGEIKPAPPVTNEYESYPIPGGTGFRRVSQKKKRSGEAD